LLCVLFGIPALLIWLIVMLTSRESSAAANAETGQCSAPDIDLGVAL
jgi:hypothetical protein